MRKIAITALLLTITVVGSAQNVEINRGIQRVSGAEVQYTDGTVLQAIGPRAVYDYNINYMTLEEMTLPNERVFIDFEQMLYNRMTILPSGDTITFSTPFEIDTEFKTVGEESYAGWNCIVAEKTVNSNRIKIYYTKELGFKGTPMPGLGVVDGLVTRIEINGRVILDSKYVSQSTASYDLFPESWGRVVETMNSYREVIKAGLERKVEIFHKDTISYGQCDVIESYKESIAKVYHVAGGPVLLKKVTLPADAKSEKIRVELSYNSIKGSHSQAGSVFIVPVNKVRNYLEAVQDDGVENRATLDLDSENSPWIASSLEYEAPVELMRFTLPHGASNSCQHKSVKYSADVTHLAQRLEGEVWIGIYIGTEIEDAHSVSLDLKYSPSENAITKQVIIPLFNTVPMLERLDQPFRTHFNEERLSVDFELPVGLKNAKLIYTITGHNNQGEFAEYKNEVIFDNQRLISYYPLSDKCVNCSNSKLMTGNRMWSMSNCTSTGCSGLKIVKPLRLSLGDVRAGKHKVEVEINPMPINGGYWSISGCIVGELE